jgi:hypothetical protein
MVIRKGTRVKWRLGSGYGRGRVEASFKQKVSQIINGVLITRYGQKNNKVLLIKNTNGREIFKLENEVERDKDKN